MDIFDNIRKKNIQGIQSSNELSIVNEDGFSPLLYAIQCEQQACQDNLYTDIIKVLIEGGANVDNPSALLMIVNSIEKCFMLPTLNVVASASSNKNLNIAFTHVFASLDKSVFSTDHKMMRVLTTLYHAKPCYQPILDFSIDIDKDKINHLYTIFMSLQEPIQPIESLQVYCMEGHGCDTGKICSVPLNCLYVTLAICGDSIKTNNRLRKKFQQMFSDADPLLQNPIVNKRAILNKLFESEGVFVNDTFITETIHVHYRGSPITDPTYMDCMYTPFSYWYERRLIGKSGLYKWGTNIINNNTDFSIENDLYNTNPKNVPPSLLHEIYKDSILPIDVKISEPITFDEIIESVGKINQSVLFERFPGIYYNIVCRTPCYPTKKGDILLRRKHSFQEDIMLELTQPGFTPRSNEILRKAVNIYCKHEREFAPIHTWDVSRITNMDELFQHNTLFNEDISDWDVSKVMFMKNIFDGASFRQSLKKWNVSVLIHFGCQHSNISELFKLPYSLQELDITGCPITTLDFDLLNPSFKITGASNLDSTTKGKLIRFYDHLIKTNPSLSTIVDQLGGKTKRKRKRFKKTKVYTKKNH